MGAEPSLAGSIVLRLREDTEYSLESGRVVFSRVADQVRFDVPSSVGPATIERLLEGDAPPRVLTDTAVGSGPEHLAAWYWTLQRLYELRMVEYVAVLEGRTLAALVPGSASFEWSGARSELTTSIRLSSFAFLRRMGERFVVASPLFPAYVELSKDAIGLLRLVVEPRTPAELASSSELSEPGAQAVLALLERARVLGPVDADGECELDRHAKRHGWSFADSVFHSRSRLGHGADQWFGAKPESRRDPIPESPDYGRPPGEPIRLFSPDQGVLGDTDPPFGTVMAERRSIRSFGEVPVSSTQLGEFLHRVARVQGPATNHDRGARPHPSGGGCYPLRIYVAAQRCEGLEPGLYRYDEFGHALIPTDVSSRTLHKVIEPCRRRGVEEFQTLILITAQIGRVSWRYDAIPYSIVLKDVGVLIQSMYLAATAMGLAPCAIGGGDSDLLPSAIGVDPLEETTVGEFALGSKP